MFKSIAIKLAKKYIINSINEVLVDYAGNVSVITSTIALWVSRLERILDSLKSINERIANDGKLDDKEIETSVNEIKEVIQKW